MTRASLLFLMAVSHLLFAAAAEAQGVSFIAGTNFGAGSSPHSVAVGDFNGDGKPDLAVANSGSANVEIIQNAVPALSVPFRGLPPRRAALRQPDGNEIRRAKVCAALTAASGQLWAKPRDYAYVVYGPSADTNNYAYVEVAGG